ncbi:hypothetical protein COV82_03835 [Candidatus Peregrinibacteria bacterium CG11_big_fil_rev_8_21_14_0_20_46_8]|nr:MAG: hypothetical protein COV82_03835 [Candidatus Peregrinibacteria bacterium CG11_big_fil_rev_8_21_14_0_20_46_8]
MALYQKLEKLLNRAGFSEIETLLYISLLKKPAQNVWELVQRLGLKKSSVYNAAQKLESLKMIERNENGIRALSLKGLIGELRRKELKTGKIAYQLKEIAPFLHAPRESIQEFEVMYTPAQITDAYLFMAEQRYDVNFDFGDFENWIDAIGPVELAKKFRTKRAKHAKHHAICTTYGENLAEFCNKSDLEKFKNRFDVIKNMNFKNRWIIFSDASDYVLFNDASEPNYPVSVLVKSKQIAEMQRLQFHNFSKFSWKE